MTLGMDLGLYRPWLSLYGNLLKIPESSTLESSDVHLAPIQKAFPNELMIHILSCLDPYSLGKAALVCKQWQALAEHPRLWEGACYDAFRLSIPDSKQRLTVMRGQYRYSWKRMFIHHPHLRFDGIYAARNTYVRTGVVEFTNHRPVHLVSYYRYFRFLPDGTFLYRTSPAVLSKVARFLAGPGVRLPRHKEGAAADADKGAVLSGRYIVKDTRVYCCLVYPNSTSTELRCRLTLRSTHPGANNRLDIGSIVTYDRDTGASSSLQPRQEPDEEVEAPHAKIHNRGLAPCVFVPWDQVHSTPMNLPPHQMDFMIV